MKLRRILLSCLLIFALTAVCLIVLPMDARAASESDLTFKLNDDGESYSVAYCDAVASAYAYPELTEMPHFGTVQSKDVEDWTGYIAISTPAELSAIRDNPSGKYYLATDILFNANDFDVDGAFYNEGACWLPIGSDSSTAFTGTLDGNGHRISGLKINHSGATIVYIGLFGYSSGTIVDLMLTDCEIIATAETATLDIGGIVGYNTHNGYLSRCSFDGTINTEDYAGGLVGVNWGTIEECYNTGEISSENYAGGIAGTNYKTISNCYNCGAISGVSYSGGIAAINSGTIDLSYNIGNINSGYYKGGICGTNRDVILSCYYLDRASLGSGYGADTATKCSIDQMQMKQTFDTYDFNYVWIIDGASNYPLPQLKNWPHMSTNSNTTDFASGTGDIWNPYIITNTTHLNNVRKDLNANYALGTDIVFAEEDFNAGGAFYNDGKGWKPVGTSVAPFAGSFDGRGYSIKGLKISAGIEGDTYIGLFGYVNGSAANTIKNINAVDFNISILGNSISTSSSYADVYIGAIVGYGSAQNCSSAGEINCTYSSFTRKAYLYIGGIIGQGSATNCTNSCTITLNINSGSAHVSSFVGGIAGRGYTVLLCVNRGTIDAYSKREWNSYIEAGGIAGYATTVNQCGNIGSVTAGGYSDVNHIYTGGILGRGTDTSTTLDQCYNTAAIKGEIREYTGGIVGCLGNNSCITNAFNAGAILNGACGGMVGYASSGTSIKYCYNVGYVEQGYDIAYRTYSDTIIENCYCLEGVATNRDGVTICTDQAMQSADTFVGFDFESIWQVGHNDKYAWPELKAMLAENDLVHIGDSTVALATAKVTYHDVQPDFTVTYNGDLLTLDEDYIAFFIVGEKAWRVNTQTRQYIHDVGTGKLLLIGNGDFCYTTTYEFNIEKYDMSKASLWTEWVSDGTGGASSSIFSLENFTYDGTAKVQSGFRVSDTYDTIEDGCFEITYVNNIEPGTATMIIAGDGDYYTGVLEKHFEIYPRQGNEGVTRVFGNTRYDTAFDAANMLKERMGADKFDAIVVACGTDFADALSGSYLANQKNAPILLVRNRNLEINQVKDYIKANLKSGGTVYLLGGVNAVPKAMETGLEGFTVKRLAGATRYETSLAIIQEAGVGNKDILVCTGKNFADGLSASAVNMPILLVKDSLTATQKTFLQGLNGNKIVIIGGTAAVNTRIENALKAYGTTERIEGATRYYTSVNIAKKYFPDATNMVVAYADNFPDGLSGGPLAYSLDAPLILTMNGKQAAAVNYAREKNITSGMVLGGTSLVSDNVVRSLFSMTSGDKITVK